MILGQACLCLCHEAPSLFQGKPACNHPRLSELTLRCFLGSPDPPVPGRKPGENPHQPSFPIPPPIQHATLHPSSPDRWSIQALPMSPSPDVVRSFSLSQ